MLTKILAAIIVALSISLGTVGYLYNGSLKANGTLTAHVTELEGLLKNANAEKEKADDIKNTTVDSLESTQKQMKEAQDQFDKILDDIKARKACVIPVVKKPTTGETPNAQTTTVDPVVDNINSVYQSLDDAYRLSNGSSSRP